MGGIDHNPTSNASKKFTVPAERALSQALASFFAGNAVVEDAIMTDEALSYGAGRGHLGLAVTNFEAASGQLGVCSSYVKQLIGVMSVGDYEPFEPTTSLDLDAFYAELVAAGLVPDAKAARDIIEVLREGSYTAVFRRYLEMIESLQDSLEVLSGLTAEMRDHEGLQGLFWASVEANRRPFRQAFAFALTKFNEVLTAWHVTALISTETYLKGTKAPGLMSNAGEVAIVERNTVVTTA